MTTTDTDNALGTLARALQTLTEITAQTGSTQDLTPVVSAISAATAIAWNATSVALAPFIATNAALVKATTETLASAAPAKAV